MTVYVDIDETICTKVDDGDYTKANPIPENLSKINNLYDNNCVIVYWTARGTGTGKDWRVVTEKQFQDWGVKYHRLEFGKPMYDLFICDKAARIEEIGG